MENEPQNLTSWDNFYFSYDIPIGVAVTALYAQTHTVNGTVTDKDR